jgi:hypothetical protein
VANRVKIDRQKANQWARYLATNYVARTARRIEHDAKLGAPVRKPGRGEPPGGTLRASIGTSVSVRGQYRVDAKVGSKLKYALVVHNGARPHLIRPRHKRFLSFYWDKAHPDMVTKSGPYAGRVLLKRVKHPGMRGTRYLTVPLRYWGRMDGYKVITRL